MTNFNIEKIYDEIQQIEEQRSELKKRRIQLDQELLAYFEKDLREDIRLKPDGCGTVTIKHSDDYHVKYNVIKRVLWDQDKLETLYKDIAKVADPKEYIKVEYKVAEQEFKSWSHSARKAFLPARSVYPTNGTITIIKKGE